MIGGCASNECLDNKSSIPLAGFYTPDAAGVPKSTGIKGVRIYGMGAQGDSVAGEGDLTQVYLPFRIDSDETSYVIEYTAESDSEGESPTDVVTFRYKMKPWFVSSACGAVYYYEMREIVSTHHRIDSVTCPNGMITNADRETIHIYLHPETPPIQ